MPKPLYIIFIILWFILSTIAILIIRDGEKAYRDQTTPSFLSRQYLLAKRASQFKELNLNIPSPEGYNDLFETIGHPPSGSNNLADDLAYYRKIVQLMPSMADAYSMLAFCYHYQGDDQQAAVNYLKAIQLNPGYFWNYYDLSIILWQAGSAGEAQKIMARALTLNPRSTLEEVASSKIYVDMMPFRQNQDPVENLENGYEIGSLLLRSSDQNAQTILNSQAKIRFF